MPLKNTLMQILKQYQLNDQVLFQAAPQSMLCLQLNDDPPYLKNGGLNPYYVEKCLQKAMEIYDFMEFGQNLLLVYEDSYDENIEENKLFLESCLFDITEHETYSLKWRFPINKNILPMHQDNTIYHCKRTLYRVKAIDIQKLFREIIKSDIGGSMSFTSAVFIIDMDSSRIFHLYDDRGLDLLAPGIACLKSAYTKYQNTLLPGTEDGAKNVFEPTK